MFKRILVAIDGSRPANRGLHAAVNLAADQKATLCIVHVVNNGNIPPAFEAGLVPAQYLEGEIEKIRVAGLELLAQAQAVAKARGVDVLTRLVEMFGQSVADSIVGEARAQNSEVILLGTHGRQGLKRFFLGSDAEAVLRHSPIPVMLVKDLEPGHEWHLHQGDGADTLATPNAPMTARNGAAGHAKMPVQTEV